MFTKEQISIINTGLDHAAIKLYDLKKFGGEEMVKDKLADIDKIRDILEKMEEEL